MKEAGGNKVICPVCNFNSSLSDSKPMPFPPFIFPPWVYLVLIQKALVLYGNRKFVSIHEWIRQSYSKIQSIQSLNVRTGRDLRGLFSLTTLIFSSNSKRLRDERCCSKRTANLSQPTWAGCSPSAPGALQVGVKKRGRGNNRSTFGFLRQTLPTPSYSLKTGHPPRTGETSS